jgi:hypothetical protein
MCDLLTDPYFDELRAMSNYIDKTLAWLDTLPLAATANPELSPDGEAVAVGGSNLGDVA